MTETGKYTGERISMVPLHVITEKYGENGLRDRFNWELERFDVDTKPILESARDLALNLHGSDRRGREPYNNHILRGAIRIMAPTHYGVDDPDIIIASLLHDSVEDHPGKLYQIGQQSEADIAKGALLTISNLYGNNVAKIVEAVSNPEFDKQGDWKHEYCEHVESSMMAEPKARPVKVSDFTDNGVGIVYSSPNLLTHFASKYLPLVNVFRKIIPLADTPLSDKTKDLILDQLDLAEWRFEVILQSVE